MKTPKTLHILAAIAMVGVLSLTGCARMPAQSAARERTTPDTSVPAATQDPTLTVEDAKVLALAHLGLAEGDFVKIVRDDGAYELDILSGDTKYEVEVDIRTGAVRELEQERILPTETPAIGQEAKNIALSHLNLTEAEFRKIELEHDHYEVELICNGTEYEVNIDAATGTVLKVDTDPDTDRHGDWKD